MFEKMKQDGRIVNIPESYASIQARYPPILQLVLKQVSPCFLKDIYDALEFSVILSQGVHYRNPSARNLDNKENPLKSIHIHRQFWLLITWMIVKIIEYVQDSLKVVRQEYE